MVAVDETGIDIQNPNSLRACCSNSEEQRCSVRDVQIIILDLFSPEVGFTNQTRLRTPEDIRYVEALRPLHIGRQYFIYTIPFNLYAMLPVVKKNRNYLNACGHELVSNSG